MYMYICVAFITSISGLMDACNYGGSIDCSMWVTVIIEGNKIDYCGSSILFLETVTCILRTHNVT